MEFCINLLAQANRVAGLEMALNKWSSFSSTWGRTKGNLDVSGRNALTGLKSIMRGTVVIVNSVVEFEKLTLDGSNVLTSTLEEGLGSTRFTSLAK